MRGLTWDCLSDRVTINHVDGPAADIVTLTRHELTTEHGKRLDTMAAHTGVVSESQHQALRADIRLLSTLLGDTLIRHGGEELLKLVEQVRALANAAKQEGSAEITSLLATLDIGTAVQLARAFSTYFQLANVAEQLHRAQEQRAYVGGQRGPLRAVLDRLVRDVDRAEVEPVLARMARGS